MTREHKQPRKLVRAREIELARGRLAQLREAAAREREAAEEYYALARETRVISDRIVHEEFARRAFEAAQVLGRHADEWEQKIHLDLDGNHS